MLRHRRADRPADACHQVGDKLVFRPALSGRAAVPGAGFVPARSIWSDLALPVGPVERSGRKAAPLRAFALNGAKGQLVQRP